MYVDCVWIDGLPIKDKEHYLDKLTFSNNVTLQDHCDLVP